MGRGREPFPSEHVDTPWWCSAQGQAGAGATRKEEIQSLLAWGCPSGFQALYLALEASGNTVAVGASRQRS